MTLIRSGDVMMMEIDETSADCRAGTR